MLTTLFHTLYYLLEDGRATPASQTAKTTLRLFISIKYLCHVILFSLHTWCIDMTISQDQEINDSFLINHVTSAFNVKILHVDVDKKIVPFEIYKLKMPDFANDGDNRDEFL